MADSHGRIVGPLIELARCSKFHRIIVAGSKGPELMSELYLRGYVRVATTATCGSPRGQYDVALVCWQGRRSPSNTGLDSSSQTGESIT
jgi:hypothetical protein